MQEPRLRNKNLSKFEGTTGRRGAKAGAHHRTAGYRGHPRRVSAAGQADFFQIERRLMVSKKLTWRSTLPPR